ncbi:hypothetical protein C8R47DRAFT_1078624 [Mycena vitilis]|nr:hypothetical protein C8R47DRAFT_1078624 [Mycena vitilis]
MSPYQNAPDVMAVISRSAGYTKSGAIMRVPGGETLTSKVTSVSSPSSNRERQAGPGTGSLRINCFFLPPTNHQLATIANSLTKSFAVAGTNLLSDFLRSIRLALHCNFSDCAVSSEDSNSISSFKNSIPRSPSHLPFMTPNLGGLDALDARSMTTNTTMLIQRNDRQDIGGIPYQAFRASDLNASKPQSTDWVPLTFAVGRLWPVFENLIKFRRARDSSAKADTSPHQLTNARRVIDEDRNPGCWRKSISQSGSLPSKPTNTRRLIPQDVIPVFGDGPNGAFVTSSLDREAPRNSALLAKPSQTQPTLGRIDATYPSGGGSVDHAYQSRNVLLRQTNSVRSGNLDVRAVGRS